MRVEYDARNTKNNIPTSPGLDIEEAISSHIGKGLKVSEFMNIRLEFRDPRPKNP